jgi:urate oxidase
MMTRGGQRRKIGPRRAGCLHSYYLNKVTPLPGIVQCDKQFVQPAENQNPFFIMSSKELLAARYGKANVRVLKVHRDPNDRNKQDVIEMRVCVLLEGEIEESYTRADNSPIVPTDTVKNTIHILAKQGDVSPIELFGSRLATHFVTRYRHIHAAHADIVQYRWTRYNVDGKPHPHSFIRDGAETRIARVSARDNGSNIEITSGIDGLKVLKSTGSMFYGYNKCEYTTLPETRDRIMSTDVEAIWTWSGMKDLATVERYAKNGLFDNAFDGARNVTLNTFAKENSASVQATMYNMASEILDNVKEISTVSYTLPNNHYFEINLSWHKGLKNNGPDAEVYAPQSDPNGLIKCTVGRDNRSKSRL